eukprot:COSAG02_NODE_12095_length_1598_cov_2.014676_1_plen_242_part_00
MSVIENFHRLPASTRQDKAFLGRMLAHVGTHDEQVYKYGEFGKRYLSNAQRCDVDWVQELIYTGDLYWAYGKFEFDQSIWVHPRILVAWSWKDLGVDDHVDEWDIMRKNPDSIAIALYTVAVSHSHMGQDESCFIRKEPPPCLTDNRLLALVTSKMFDMGSLNVRDMFVSLHKIATENQIAAIRDAILDVVQNQAEWTECIYDRFSGKVVKWITAQTVEAGVREYIATLHEVQHDSLSASK